MRLALGLNIDKSVMNKLELMIGHQLDQATLDNLLVPSPLKSSHLYYVSLVLRFTKAFLNEAKRGSRSKLITLVSTPLLINIKLKNGNRELTEIDKGDRTTKQGNKTRT